MANEPDSRDAAEYRDKLRQISQDNDLTDSQDVNLVEITVPDSFEVATTLQVQGHVMHQRYRVELSPTGPAGRASTLPETPGAQP